jgi:hypothetical protein
VNARSWAGRAGAGERAAELKTAWRDGTSHLLFDPVVRYDRPAPDATAPAADARPRTGSPRSAWTWAVLMHRVFALDVLACPRCGGRLQVIAIVQHPAVVRTLLAHGGRARSPGAPGPAPPARAAIG